MKKHFDPIVEPNGVPGFRNKNHTYRLLNLGLEVQADGVTCHLSSEFEGMGEMGAVIDTIELERNRRNTA